MLHSHTQEPRAKSPIRKVRRNAMPRIKAAKGNAVVLEGGDGTTLRVFATGGVVAAEFMRSPVYAAGSVALMTAGADPQHLPDVLGFLCLPPEQQQGLFFRFGALELTGIADPYALCDCLEVGCTGDVTQVAREEFDGLFHLRLKYAIRMPARAEPTVVELDLPMAFAPLLRFADGPSLSLPRFTDDLDESLMSMNQA